MVLPRMKLTTLLISKIYGFIFWLKGYLYSVVSLRVFNLCQHNPYYTRVMCLYHREFRYTTNLHHMLINNIEMTRKNYEFI
jgi:hypothetical protein